MPSQEYRHIIQAIEYTGDNLAEMTEAASSYYPHTVANYPTAFVSAYYVNGNDLKIETDIYNFTMTPGMWLFQDGGNVGTTNDGVNITALYTPVTDVPSPTLAVGYAVTPNLTAGASTTVEVPMVPSLPDSGYNVGVALAGSTQLLGALAILSATVAGSAQVDVVVQNTDGLLTLGGATVLVTALHNG